MSAALDRPVPAPSSRAPARAVIDAAALHLADVAVLAAVGWWAAWLTFGTGGREPGVLSIGVGLVLTAALVVRPWQVLPPWTSVVALAPGAGAWIVVLTAPTGWAGSDDAASYTYAGALGLVALAWARDPLRRQLLVAAVVGAAGLQIAAGWAAWWAVPSPSRLFQGTFYWHNQEGAFLSVGAVVAFALVADGRRPLATLGWCLAPLCVAGTVFTTSRGSMIGLGLGALLVLAASVSRPGRAAAMASSARVVAAAGISWATTWILTGPPFFDERFSPTAATDARAASFGDNGIQRLEDWRRSWEIFQHWPGSGAGFNSFSSATTVVTERPDGVATAFAHNGYLQAAADGGLVLLVPLLSVLGVVLVRALRALSSARRAGDLVQPGALAALVVLLLHSGMDFDWTYPALLAQAALVAVLAAPAGPTGPQRAGRHPAVAVMVLALLAVSVVGAWGGGLDLNASV